MTDELKPCPFCGGAELVVADNGGIACLLCWASGPPAKAETEAIAAWNRRASPDGTGLLIAAIRALREKFSSLNGIPIERVTIRDFEWAPIEAALQTFEAPERGDPHKLLVRIVELTHMYCKATILAEPSGENNGNE